MGDLSNLVALDLSKNLLSGEIPPELGYIVGLRSLHLSDNLLSGCIPAVLRPIQFHDLARLGLWHCDVLLDDLNIGPGELNQVFDPNRTSYTAVSDAAIVTVTAVPGEGGMLRYLDNLNRTQADADGERAGHQVVLRSGVTFARVRLNSVGGEEERTYTVLIATGELFRRYDVNENRAIERDEVLRAVEEYLAGELSRDEAVGMIQLYFFH